MTTSSGVDAPVSDARVTTCISSGTSASLSVASIRRNMKPEVINHSSKEEWLTTRMKDVTSSEVAALFGCNPYLTEFEMFHRKREGVVVQIVENERMRWGTRLQDAIALGIAEDNGWKVRRADEYMRLPVFRMGSSFDFFIDDDGILEVKNVDSLVYRDGWEIDGNNIEAPPHIELQVQHQLAVSGRKYAYIGALVGGNRVELLKRTPDEVVIGAIKAKVLQFWEDIADDKEPKPDWERDAKFISKLYSHAEPGKLLDIKGDVEFARLAEQYKAASAQIKSAEDVRDAFKAQILTRIGDAEKVTGEKFTISAGIVGPAHVEYDREGYRSFKLSWKREKKSD